MYAIRIAETGGVDALRYEQVDAPAPAAGEALVKNLVIGVNFIDTYQRSGLYPLPLPATLGVEAGGVVSAVGAGVDSNLVGKEVVYFGRYKSYAEYSAVPVDALSAIPHAIDIDSATAIYTQGLTAHYLLHDVFPLRGNEWVVVLAAAGGVGRLLCQWAHRKGARVIGAVSSEYKESIVREAGVEHCIRYDREPLRERIRELTRGEGADVVFDSVGKKTIRDSMQALRRRGMLVSYGQSSGAVESVPLQDVARGSLFLTRPTIFDYITTPSELAMRAEGLFAAVELGIISPLVYKQLSLSEAGQAHTLLESRQSTGKLLLRP